MARAVIAILSIAIVVGLAVFGLQAASAEAGTERTITDESFSPTAGSVTTLDHSELEYTTYGDTVTVEDSNGQLMDAGEDYVWIESNGTIKTVSGGDLDGASSATIDYQYRTTSSDQRALIGLVGTFSEALTVLLPLLGVAILLVLVRG